MSHPTFDHQKYMDTLTIVTILKEHGPLSYHDLLVKACAHGVDVSRNFDEALACALSTCFIKGQFAACTAEEQRAHHDRSIHPAFDKPEPGTRPVLPPEEAMFKLIQQRSDWIKAGRDEEDEG